MFRNLVILCFLCSIVISSIVCEDNNDFRVDAKCAENVKCIDDKIYEIAEKIDKTEAISLIGGVEIVKVPVKEDKVGANGRDQGLWDWIEGYIDSHTLTFENNIEEGRTKKLKKFLIPLLILLKLKIGLILPTVLSTIALIAIKGLFAGVTGIIISGITALKAFGDGKQDRVTAIVAPIPADVLKHHSDYGTRWSRLGQELQGSPSGLIPQPVGPTANLLTQAYAADPALDPYSAYSPYPTMINTN